VPSRSVSARKAAQSFEPTDPTTDAQRQQLINALGKLVEAPGVPYIGAWTTDDAGARAAVTRRELAAIRRFDAIDHRHAHGGEAPAELEPDRHAGLVPLRAVREPLQHLHQHRLRVGRTPETGAHRHRR
jgi:hypothetical protein